MLPETTGGVGRSFDVVGGASCSGVYVARPFPLSSTGECCGESAGCEKPGIFSSSKSSSSSGGRLRRLIN